MGEGASGRMVESGELFVVRMLQPGAEGMTVEGLDLERVRGYLAERKLPNARER